MYISHWYDDFDFHQKSVVKNERYKRQFIEYLKQHLNFKVHHLSENFTHHDAHAWSVKSFYDFYKGDKHANKVGVMVVDGFGNQQEVISLYTFDHAENSMKLKKRFYGYQKSLGLMYQYATSYCGMKENEDEYKFLGYESHFQKVVGHLNITGFLIYKYEEFMKSLGDTVIVKKNDYIDLDELEKARAHWTHIFDQWIEFLETHTSNKENKKLDTYERRVVVGFLIQFILESVVATLINDYFYDEGIDTVLCAGGVFYNVKLNNTVMKTVQHICVMPAAGDQGTALGFYYHEEQKPINYSTLCWGYRNYELGQTSFNDVSEVRRQALNGIEVVFANSPEYLKFSVFNSLVYDEIVQVVSGHMEFGPRALCNTSTFARPTQENVDIINAINGRNTVMPFAPVMREDDLKFFFEEDQVDKVIGSLNFMIITLDYKEKITDEENFNRYVGIMHKYPIGINKYSGRPQVIAKDHFIYDVLTELCRETGDRALINTSYNVHGRPIVYSAIDAIEDFKYQQDKIKELGITKPVRLIIYQ